MANALCYLIGCIILVVALVYASKESNKRVRELHQQYFDRLDNIANEIKNK